MSFLLLRSAAIILWALFATNYVVAQVSSGISKTVVAPIPGKLGSISGESDAANLESSSAMLGASAKSMSLNDWLVRLQEAASKRAYVGTFVVSSGAGMASAKIWHVCVGNQQMERVEMLTGAPRSIFRHNDKVVTFIPDHKLVRREKHESLGLFPELLASADSHIADFYTVKQVGIDRVAGVEADVVALLPKDKLRFGYRVWTERKSGLVVKLQTLDTDGKLLEQAAFSELEIDAPVKMDKLVQMMDKVDGYRVEKPVLVKTSASAEGWTLKTPVTGFKSMSCYKRPLAASRVSSAGAPFQWVFSDGLASVSIFVEPLDKQRHYKESTLSLGATHTMTRMIDLYWVTVVGEVPVATLLLFANGLEHKK